ncbi:MAG: peptidylprolyl isomerase [Flavobacteriia bacterium]|nr:peptidylprolyl isomerase [Flavobacteriia bacterium]
MKKHLFTLAVGLSFCSFAQDEVLFTVEGEPVTAEEFSYVYNKNKDVGREIDPKTPREYLDLYINFKLKVHEAEALGMDTTRRFVREFGSYSEQLARPYMTVKEVNDQVLREAYNHLAWDVRARHIMLDVAPNALPEDTLRVYNQLMTVREQILNGQRTFESAARAMSTDTYSAQRGGDLGWFTAFNMVYPFEKAAYRLDADEISMPVRTQFGYHLIETTDRRPSRGKIEVAHILAQVDPNGTEEQQAAAKAKIDEIYEKLQNGSDFAELARQLSDDKTTASMGGVLPAFGMKEMLPEFEEASFGIENDGEISAPFKTKIGWHIVKRIHRYDLGTFESVKPELVQKIQRDTRSNLGQQVFLNKLRNEYNFTTDEDNLMDLLEEYEEGVKAEEWSAEDFEDETDEIVYSFADREISQAEVAKVLTGAQDRFKGSESIKSEAYGFLNNWVKNELIAYEREHLADKYPDFRFLVQEYREGILLFDLTKEMVWDKASQDSAGLANFYNANKQEYSIGPRHKYVRFSVATRKVADAIIADLQNGSTSGSEILSKYNQESMLTVGMDTLKVLVGNDEKIDEAGEGNIFTYQEDNRWIVPYVIETLPAGIRPLDEIKGLVTSDYQKQLEAQWVEELRAKYEVEVNESVMSELESEL